MTPVFDVAIVGFGPTGAVAAALLGQAGLHVHVCDLRDGIYDKPRAVALDHEILRVFDQIGVLGQVEPWLEPFTDSEYVGVDGQLIKCMTTVAPPYPMAYTPSVVFSQPPVEQALPESPFDIPPTPAPVFEECPPTPPPLAAPLAPRALPPRPCACVPSRAYRAASCPWPRPVRT